MMPLEPEAESSWVAVGARAKMSLALGWALSTVWRVRYCFDCRALGEREHGEHGQHVA